MIFYLWCQIRHLDEWQQYHVLWQKIFKYDPAPHNGRLLTTARKGTAFHLDMQYGRCKEHLIIHISCYIGLKKYLVNLVWTQKMFTGTLWNKPHFSLPLLSDLPPIRWNMSFFYYKNVAQKIKLLTFTNTFAHWLNMEQTCCVKG